LTNNGRTGVWGVVGALAGRKSGNVGSLRGGGCTKTKTFQGLKKLRN